MHQRLHARPHVLPELVVGRDEHQVLQRGEEERAAVELRGGGAEGLKQLRGLRKRHLRGASPPRPRGEAVERVPVVAVHHRLEELHLHLHLVPLIAHQIVVVVIVIIVVSIALLLIFFLFALLFFVPRSCPCFSLRLLGSCFRVLLRFLLLCALGQVLLLRLFELLKRVQHPRVHHVAPRLDALLHVQARVDDGVQEKQHVSFEAQVHGVVPQHLHQARKPHPLPAHELEVVHRVQDASVPVPPVHHDHGQELEHLRGHVHVFAAQVERERGHQRRVARHGLDAHPVVHRRLQALEKLRLQQQLVVAARVHGREVG
mmetsp:Transcript_70106/g.141175  ORF Transcript_70106/g.141175 Transcript_70106/m.141175 type:complete len:316 (-) Transcript_70106:534-1481(-)